MVRNALGDSLGRLADPAGTERFERQRLAMVDQLFAREATGQLDHSAWSTAFGEAVEQVATQVLHEGEGDIRSMAGWSRYPSRKLQAALPNQVQIEAFRQRLLATAMPLERFENVGDDADARRARGVALETAWEGVSKIAHQEATRWATVASRVEAWRRPTPLLWTATALSLIATAVISAWLGGLLPAPEWFDGVGSAFWKVFA